MAKLTLGQSRAILRAEGATDQQAIILSAIMMPESGGNTEAQGDQHLTNNKWGISYGAWQIRTLRTQTGTGKCRDIQALRASIRHQARCAVKLANSATGFNHWTAYKTGAYQQHLSAARTASTQGVDVSNIMLASTDGDGGIPLPPTLENLKKAGRIASTTANALGTIAQFFANIDDNWPRIMAVLGGVILIVLALAFLGAEVAGSTPIGKAAIRVSRIQAAGQTIGQAAA